MLIDGNIIGRWVWRTAIMVILAGLMTTDRPASARPPDPQAVRRAYDTAEMWVRQFSVPDEAEPLPVGGAAAVQVTLRASGIAVGRATVAAPDPLDPADEQDEPQPRDLTPLLRQAVREALEQAADTLFRARAVGDELPALLLDLQVAGAPQPVRIERLAELPSELTIDVHGLAMRHGAAWAWQFPGSSIAANIQLDSQLRRLMADLNLPPEQLPRVGREDSPALYRFEAIHRVRPTAEEPPLLLHRGNLLLPPAALSEGQIDALGGRLLDHLLQRQRPNGSFAGTYEPTSGQYQPASAGLVEMMQAAWVLGRVARFERAETEHQQRAAEAAQRAVTAWTRAQQAARGPVGPNRHPLGGQLAPIAATLLALLDVPGVAEHRSWRQRLAATLETLQQPDGRFITVVGESDRIASASLQALAAFVMVRLYDRTRDPETLDGARRALGVLWDDLEAESVTDALPWLAYAETDLARIGQPTGRAAQLVERCERLWRRQVQPWGPEHERRSPDTIGGFLRPGDLIDEPDWQTAHTLTAAALLLRSPGLVPEEDRPRWLLNCGLAARFLAQLTMDEPACYYVRSRSEAIGGVRIAFWDNRQPLYATTAAVEAITELQKALAGPALEAPAADE